MQKNKIKLIKRKSYLAFSQPNIGREEKKAILDILDSRWLTTGPVTAQFESAFAQYTGSRYALAVNSCTAAIHLCLISLNIGPGAEVILPTMTFVSTAHEIIHCGAKPVLIDIEPDTFNINPDKIEEKINRHTRAIIITHYGGHPGDMDKILSLSKKYKIPVIEDAAHAHGSEYRGIKIGALPSYSTCFSFYPTKNMTTAEGGMLTTHNKKLIDLLRIYSLHGIKKDAWKRYAQSGSWYYDVIYPGYKYNMSDLLSAIGLCQLKKLDLFNRKRTNIAELYSKLLSPIPEIRIPIVQNYIKPNWHLYPLLGKNWSATKRNQIIEQLKKWNIGTSVHFIPIHRHPYYRNQFKLNPKHFPIAESVYSRIISLPIYPDMREDDVEYVVRVLKNFL